MPQSALMNKLFEQLPSENEIYEVPDWMPELEEFEDSENSKISRKSRASAFVPFRPIQDQNVCVAKTVIEQYMLGLEGHFPCQKITIRDVTFPKSKCGTIKAPCPNDYNGTAVWQCNIQGWNHISPPDLSS